MSKIIVTEQRNHRYAAWIAGNECLTGSGDSEAEAIRHMVALLLIDILTRERHCHWCDTRGFWGDDLTGWFHAHKPDCALASVIRMGGIP
jgi:hypothetical protein